MSPFDRLPAKVRVMVGIMNVLTAVVQGGGGSTPRSSVKTHIVSHLGSWAIRQYDSTVLVLCSHSLPLTRVTPNTLPGLTVETQATTGSRNGDNSVATRHEPSTPALEVAKEKSHSTDHPIIRPYQICTVSIIIKQTKITRNQSQKHHAIRPVPMPCHTQSPAHQM